MHLEKCKYLQSQVLFGMFMAELSYEKFKRFSGIGGSSRKFQQADKSITVNSVIVSRGLLEEIDLKLAV